MWPDRVSNLGLLALESDMLPAPLRENTFLQDEPCERETNVSLSHFLPWNCTLRSEGN